MLRTKMIPAVSALLCLTLLSDCAYYPIAEQPIKSKDFYADRVEKSGLALTCRRVENGGEAALIFGSDLPAGGVVPLEIILFNDSAESVDLSNASVNVKNAEDGPAKTLTVNEAYTYARRSTAKRTLSWGIAGTLLLFFTIPFALIGWFDSFRSNKQLKRTLTALKNIPKILEPKKSIRWFVYLDRTGIGVSGLDSDVLADLLIEVSGLRFMKTGQAEDLHLVI